MVLAIVMCPGQGLLRVDVHVVSVVTAHRTEGTLRIAGLIVGVTILHTERLVYGHIRTERKIFQEFGFQIADHVQVVERVLAFIVLEHVQQVVIVVTCSRVSDGRRLLSVVFNVDFFSIFVFQAPVCITFPHLCQQVSAVQPVEKILVYGTRVTSPTYGHGLLRTAAVSHINACFQPFGYLSIDV